MLISILNICSKEELEEEDDMLIEVPTPGAQVGASTRRSEGSEDFSERRTVIKNKILAVGRMARVFAVLRCVLYAYAVRKPSECPNSRLLLARAG